MPLYLVQMRTRNGKHYTLVASNRAMLEKAIAGFKKRKGDQPYSNIYKRKGTVTFPR